ncbi:putative ribonuclease H-like domain-containing protein [Tanacetum coccineum]|uniref:Ribonuclease H-like domain-containing protein n=1 Tax=Tanacetum coccineum TaxID=301880 RepID=A0ABQ4YWW6_9ASTR
MIVRIQVQMEQELIRRRMLIFNCYLNNIDTVSPTVNAAGIKDNAVDENIVYGCADDPNMPNLEEIVYSNDDEDNDAEADMNNLNTFMPVSPIPTTRLHKDHPLEQIIRDIHSAPQTTRMTKSVTEHVEPKKVWTLVDLPYGKRAIGTKWVYMNKKDKRVTRIEAIRLFLAYASYKYFVVYQMDVKSAFLYGKIEEEVYVDDIIFRSTKKVLCTKFEKLMHKKFQMSSMGELTFFLGLQVTQTDDGIFISQDKCVDEILKKFGFLTVKTASTPMETSKPLMKDESVKDVDVHLYRSMIGSLMYLTSSRRDIMFAVCACARFQVTPKVSHVHAVKGIFRYLKVTMLQTVAVNSTTEAEYVAASNSCGQTKHIEIRHHFIRDSNEKKLIQMIKIHTDQNVADLLTKAFDVGRFQYLIASIGMLNL